MNLRELIVCVANAQLSELVAAPALDTAPGFNSKGVVMTRFDVDGKDTYEGKEEGGI